MKMRLHRFIPALALMLFPVLALGQSNMSHAADNATPSEAAKSFTELKTLAGTWQGVVTADPKMDDVQNAHLEVTMRVTSRGNALVHEMQEAGTALDPTRYDHPVTMLYLDGDRLFLTHYCDAGNRPRMVARPSSDGKKVEFDFLDLSGGNENGHMYHAVFTLIDANHHTEDWAYMMPGDKPMHVHFDLQREK
jgi:hypothetical protein